MKIDMGNPKSTTDPTYRWLATAGVALIIVDAMVTTFLLTMGMLIGDPILISDAVVIWLVCGVPALIFYFSGSFGRS